VVEPRRCVVALNESEQPVRQLSKDTRTFALASEDGTALASVHDFYRDLKTFGKHFRVRSLDNPDVYRHYTICNVMNPPMYDEIIRCLKANSGDDFSIGLQNQGKDESQFIRLTVKDYK